MYFLNKLVLEGQYYDGVMNWASRCLYVINRYPSRFNTYGIPHIRPTFLWNK